VKALYHHRTQGRGVEAVHIHGVCGGLEKLGYEVEIIGPPGVTTDPNIVVAAEAGKTGTSWGVIAKKAPQWLFELMEIGYNLVAIPRVLKRCRELQPELIYERYSLYNVTAAFVSAMTGVPLVLEVNDTVGTDRTRQGKSIRMKPVARVFERWIFKRTAGITVVSGYLKDQVISSGVPSEKIAVTPNAVDVDRFDRSRVDGTALRERLGLKGKTVIGFAGSFTKWHGLDLLVQAFANVSPELREARLLLVGDGVTMEDTRALVEALGITDRVVFTGKVGHADVPEHMAAMDVGVMPESNVFGSPMKVYEYLAMGVPAVGPRYGPLEEAIVDGEDGLIFTPGDVDGLTAALRSLVADTETRRAMGESGRRKVVSRHQWVHNAEAVVHLVSASKTSNRTEPAARPSDQSA